MATWPVLKHKDVVSVDVAKAEYILSRDGFQKGMASGEAGKELVSVGRILQEFSPRIYEEIENSDRRFIANVGIPGTNECPEFLFLGVYINGFHYTPGSRRLNLSFAVMLHATVSAAQGYTDIREAVPIFIDDVKYLANHFLERFQDEGSQQFSPEYRLYDVRRPETIEKNAVQALISGGQSGEDV